MLYSLDQYREKFAHQEAAQNALNSTMNSIIAAAVYEAVKDHAQVTHAAYPQYKGHWDGWRPVRFTREVRTKMGLAFAVGDYSIVREREQLPNMPDYRHTAFSTRNDVDTAVPAGSFVYLDA